jgi:EAL domain-containing protein (putative c-di-GMP-specific phosphodiesterase class I)
MMAEGVEKAEEYDWLRRAGVNFFQGFYFAKPAFEALPEVAGDLFSV